MSVQTRYHISDVDVPIKSFSALKEIPYFLSHHKQRLRSIGDVVATVSNSTVARPTFMTLNTFHHHQTVYAAVDSLAPPLAEFFERTDILPIVNPIFAKYEEEFKYWDHNLWSIFVRRGVLIPKEARE